MTTRRIGLLALIALLAPLASSAHAAKARSKNFVVEAADPRVAQEFAQLAEKFRREKAVEWLGREMPEWPQPCPLTVNVQPNGAGGATSFNFEGGYVYQRMEITGAIDRLRVSVLPHEVTHTVFAHHFRRPVPRWADEGGAVYSEDDLERNRHDKLCRQALNAGRGFTLRNLFAMTQYPGDVGVLYAQGYSITAYLIEKGDRARFLNFVGQGMQYGWDAAVRQSFGLSGVAGLEQEWLEFLRQNDGPIVRGTPKGSFGSPDASGDAPAAAELTSRVVVRDFALPALPDLDGDRATVRGSSPDGGPASWNASGTVRLGTPVPAAPAAPALQPKPWYSSEAAPLAITEPVSRRATPARPVSATNAGSGVTPVTEGRRPPPPVTLFLPD